MRKDGKQRPLELGADEFADRWAARLATVRDRADFRADLERMLLTLARNPPSSTNPDVAPFDTLDSSLLVVAPVYAIAVYTDDNGDIVIRQERPKDEDDLVVVPARHAHVVAAAVQRQCAGSLFTSPHDATLGRRAFEREVQHRVRNTLQGAVGLLRRFADRHTSLEPLLAKSISQLQAIETIHSIAAQYSRNGVSLVRIVQALVPLVDRATGIAVECEAEHNVSDAILVRKNDTVALGLVLNELLMNAARHRAPGSAVRVSTRAYPRRAVIEISNRGALDANFDLRKGAGIGDGLELVRVLLPPQGADLRYASGGGYVQATLELAPPVFLTSP